MCKYLSLCKHVYTVLKVTCFSLCVILICNFWFKKFIKKIAAYVLKKKNHQHEFAPKSVFTMSLPESLLQPVNLICDFMVFLKCILVQTRKVFRSLNWTHIYSENQEKTALIGILILPFSLHSRYIRIYTCLHIRTQNISSSNLNHLT